ncbi:helix-turn-helix domain-containing protein (plasmid) [Streptomyces sp. NBC_01136]|uniref:helix-turn-helix domain-containing protein n=1 Tax=unclassified Streptomyces TaxID=2593676 RepID=UPI002F90A2FC|nr:helix-turn-helix domain-containing protein [Streptomyces sp. NBC_01136]
MPPTDDRHTEAADSDPGSLGLELRRLRKARGLSQRQLAKLLGFTAHSAICDYESGKRLPPNDVLLACERLFRLPPGQLQEHRVRHLARQAEVQYQRDRQALGPKEEPAGLAEADPAEPVREARPSPRRHRLSRRGAVVLAGVAVAGVAVVTAVAANSGGVPGDLLWSSGASNQHVSDKALQYDKEPMDGDDPRARGCDLDAAVRQTVPLVLPGGAAFGRLRLRHSNRCAASWGSALYGNPRMYTVYIQIDRPSDGAEVRSEWGNNTPPGSYGDMLSTGTGCVTVEAWVRTDHGTGPHAKTSCMR